MALDKKRSKAFMSIFIPEHMPACHCLSHSIQALLGPWTVVEHLKRIIKTLIIDLKPFIARLYNDDEVKTTLPPFSKSSNSLHVHNKMFYGINAE